MTTRKNAKLTAEKQRELQVAAAVAREALLQMHVIRALKLIELAGNRVSVMRMLGIYTRVHVLPAADAEAVSNRLLAVLGHRAKKGDVPLVYVEGEEENVDKRSFVGVVRDRLRGRLLHDLRRRVELHTGSTQAALLDLHVKHAASFVAQLAESHAISDALHVYHELVDVPANMVDALYIFVLDSLAADELPRTQARAEQTQKGATKRRHEEALPRGATKLRARASDYGGFF